MTFCLKCTIINHNFGIFNKIVNMYVSTMNQSDVDYLAKLLNVAIKQQDWDSVTEALDYVIEFQDDPITEEE